MTLQLTQLVGFGVGGAAAVLPTLSYIGEANSTADLTTYTFSGVAIGTAAATRRVIVAVAGSNSSSVERTISSVTVGGISATQLVAQSNSGGTLRTHVALWIADVPSGATADIVVAWSGAQLWTHIGVWAAYDLESAAARDTAASVADPSSLNIDVLDGGMVLAAQTGASNTTTAWTGLTENWDTNIAVETLSISGASASALAAQTNRTVEGDYSTANTPAAVAVALR